MLNKNKLVYLLVVWCYFSVKPSRSSGSPKLDVCEPDCSLTCSNSDLPYQPCRCDPQCVLYGDCCSEVSRTGCTCRTNFAENVAIPPFHCQDSNSITISDVSFSPIVDSNFFWYWMVTSCSDDWVLEDDVIDLELRQAVESMCVNTTLRLPPATDMNTVFDYRNEYCALCNRIRPENIIRWEYNYECDPEYRLLIENSNNYMFTEDDIEMYCTLSGPRKPSFILPSTGQPSSPERPCYPMRPPNCLDRDVLKNVTGEEWNQMTYDMVRESCINSTSQTPVTHNTISSSNSLPFPNRDCAICNGFPENELNCFAPIQPDITGGLGPQPFSVLLDINNDGLIVISSETVKTTLQVSCSTAEIYDPVSKMCRSIEFQECIQKTNVDDTIAMLVNGECITSTCNKQQLLALNDSISYSYHNSTSIYYKNESFVIEYTNSQGEPVICVNTTTFDDQIIIACNGSLISLNSSEMFSYVDADSIVYGGEVYDVEFNNSRGEPVICVDFSNNGTQVMNTTVEVYGYPIAFSILTYIGCSLSFVGCVLVLLTYSLFKELRTLPSKILMNLVVAILISNALILLGVPVVGTFPDVIGFCTAIATLLHYFTLLQFSWMSIMSFEMVRTFYKAYKMTVDETNITKHVFFVVYLFIGWTLPLAISIATIVVNFTTKDLVLYGVLEDGTLGSCWINHFLSAVVAMVVPVAVSLIFNTVMFAITIIFLIQAYRSQSHVKKTRKLNVSYFRLTVAVFTVSGLSWGFGFIAILVGTSWSWYPFIILNSIQGFIIFLAFLCTKKIGKLYLSLFKCQRRQVVSSLSTKQSTKQSINGSKLSKSDTYKIELKHIDSDGTTF